MHKLKHRVAWISVFIFGVLAGVFLCMRGDLFSRAAAVGTVEADNIIQPVVFNIENAVIDVAGVVGKAVVSISTEHTQKISGNSGSRRFYFGSPFNDEQFGDQPFSRFFDDFFDAIPDREFKQMGLGSGVIIDKEGYVLTNEHVVNDADKITVTLPDGRKFDGEVKGKDTRADLAVIKINAHDLPAASLGNSDQLKIGQWVVAIGNPFGFALDNPEPTVTVGVVSALNRSLGRSLGRGKELSDLIQTDAAINPGNSGGPLVNLKGEIVGINVAIFSTTGGYQGIGFAIPSNKAGKILAQLIEGKKILYGWLGVTVQDLDEKLAGYFGFGSKTGVLVNEAIKGGPADKAGIKNGDIISSFSGKPLSSVKDLLKAVGEAEVGKRAVVELWRDKKELKVSVEIGERPEDAELAATGAVKNTGNWRGLGVKNITSEIRQQLNIDNTAGVVVNKVESDSPADEAGIIRGDIIDQINKTDIVNLDDFSRVVLGLKGDALIRTNRGYVVVKEK